VLADYPLQPEGHAQITTEAAQFAEKVQDISQFLYTIHWPEDIRFSPLAKRVAVHDPCSLSHVLHQQDRPYALLNKIPSIQLVPLADNGHCCGAAGLYMLAYPKIAEALLQKKLFALKAINPEILVTSNIGCALHLAAGIRQQGMDIEVMHPVTLLARQMQ
jgi:glycolate oxidase iron-sulfur subunit